jgi:lipopolysaccharide/colanic/teichoic acid biosynthesis glycosyltransferase
MLIQMPRGSGRQPNLPDAADCSPFEAALRRDLASAPVVPYDATLGGWSKRAVDLTLTLLSAPIWGPLLIGVALWAKSRHSASVFEKHERVGYGCRLFACYSLRLNPPTAVVEPLRKDGDMALQWEELKRQADGSLTKWSRAMERLPQLWSVLRGDMALVGPRPLSRDQLAALKSGKRYYLSARPGVIGTSGVADADDANASHHKIYSMVWSHSTDALLAWDALSSLLQEGELWKPTRRVFRTGIKKDHPREPTTAAE